MAGVNLTMFVATLILSFATLTMSIATLTMFVATYTIKYSNKQAETQERTCQLEV